MPINYDVPDVQPGRNGLSVWPVLADGKRIGCVVERERGYQPRLEVDAPWTGPVLSFRGSAIEEIKRRYEAGQS